MKSQKCVSSYFRLLLLLWAALTWAATDHIHWGSLGNPLRGLTINWHDTGTSDSLKWGYTSSFEMGTVAGVRRADYSGYLFSYTFPVLQLAAIIHYSLKSSAWETERTFRSSTDTANTTFSFIAGGDSRTNMTDWQAIANRIAADPVDFHLFVGDLVNSGSTATDWTPWYQSGAAFLDANLAYYCRGNHEDDGVIFANQFTLPGAKLYYTFEFGDVRFICLNSSDPANTTQQNWLRNTLQTNLKKWTIVFFHAPFYTIGGHAGEMDAYFPTWWSLFDSTGVDIVINGHTHHYMRSVPINRQISTTSGVSKYGSKAGEGRLEVVAGAYGAPLYSCGTAWYGQTCASVIHYTRWNVEPDKIHMSAINVSGVLIDSLTLVKNTVQSVADRAIPVVPPYLGLAPTPAGASSIIMLSCGLNTNWEIKIYSTKGSRVYQTAGRAGEKIRWNSGSLASGYYPVVLTAAGRKYSGRLLIIR